MGRGIRSTVNRLLRAITQTETDKGTYISFRKHLQPNNVGTILLVILRAVCVRACVRACVYVYDRHIYCIDKSETGKKIK